MLSTSRIQRFQTDPIVVRLTVHCPWSGFVGSAICHLHDLQGLRRTRFMVKQTDYYKLIIYLLDTENKIQL